jgi:hypothetical protein
MLVDNGFDEVYQETADLCRAEAEVTSGRVV